MAGGAGMLIYSADTEQGFNVRFWGATGCLVLDCEGLTLVSIPQSPINLVFSPRVWGWFVASQIVERVREFSPRVWGWSVASQIVERVRKFSPRVWGWSGGPRITPGFPSFPHACGDGFRLILPSKIGSWLRNHFRERTRRHRRRLGSFPYR